MIVYSLSINTLYQSISVFRISKIILFNGLSGSEVQLVENKINKLYGQVL